MLKRFFISMLGTMAGLWISIALLVISGIIVGVMALGKGAAQSAVKVDKNSVLVLDLSGNINERYQPASFLDMIQDMENDSPSLDKMTRALRAAADDDKIDGLYLKCRGASMGYASREELLNAIEYFHESGKWIYAYADTYTQGDYLLASAADSVYLNPMGAVDIHGVAAMTPFFKGLLDKLGVKMQIVKVGTFKSAVEPYILDHMSEPARLQMQQYCDSLWAYVAGNIATDREISVDTIRAMASQVINCRKGDFFIKSGLADHLVYERTVDDRIREACGLARKEDLKFISPSDYLQASSDKLDFKPSKKHIAVLYAVGDIVDSGDSGIVGSDMVSQIVTLADDDNVKGMVFRVNSPGGSAFASEQIWEAIQYFKSKDKPVYVSMGDYAASGGYYISCGANTIFADATTLTGSIGVFGMIPDFSGLVTDKLGVNFSTVETNPNAQPSLMSPLTPTYKAALQQSVENIYDLFTSRVAEGRGLSQDSVKAIAEGRVWVGASAIGLGLVDHIGNLYDAIEALADNLDMDATDVVAYPKHEEDFWLTMLRNSKDFKGMDMKKDIPFDSETLRTMMLVKRLRNANPVQARMPDMSVR